MSLTPDESQLRNLSPCFKTRFIATSHNKSMLALLLECSYDELGLGNKSYLTDEFTSSQGHLAALVLYRFNNNKNSFFGIAFIYMNN